MADWHTLYNALSYDYGQCTQFVAGTYSWVGAHWGNGCEWLESAKRDGFKISSTPISGGIAVYSCSLPGSGGDGHVAAVGNVNTEGTFQLTEANWDGFNQTDVRTESLNSGTGKYIIGFIAPPGTDLLLSNNKPSSGANPFDPSGLTNTLGDIGNQIEADLIKVGLSLLGFFIIVLGVGLLLSGELRTKAQTSFKGKESPNAQVASKALEVTA